LGRNNRRGLHHHRNTYQLRPGTHPTARADKPPSLRPTAHPVPCRQSVGTTSVTAYRKPVFARAKLRPQPWPTVGCSSFRYLRPACTALPYYHFTTLPVNLTTSSQTLLLNIPCHGASSSALRQSLASPSQPTPTLRYCRGLCRTGSLLPPFLPHCHHRTNVLPFHNLRSLSQSPEHLPIRTRHTPDRSGGQAALATSYCPSRAVLSVRRHYVPHPPGSSQPTPTLRYCRGLCLSGRFVSPLPPSSQHRTQLLLYRKPTFQGPATSQRPTAHHQPQPKQGTKSLCIHHVPCMAAASATTISPANQQTAIPCGITHTRRRSTILSQAPTAVEAPGKAVLVSAMGLVPSAQLQGCFAAEPKKILSGYAVRFFWFGKPLHQCSRSPILSLASAPPPFSGRSIGSRGRSLHCHSAPGGGGVPPRHPPLPPPPRAVLLRLRAPRAIPFGR